MKAQRPPTNHSRAPHRRRLTLALGVVLAAHVVVLSIRFELYKPERLSQSLEVTLATFKAEKKPQNADYLAQLDQEGSGSLEHKALPTTTEQALLQDTQVNRVSPPAGAPPAEPQSQQQKVLTSHTGQIPHTLVQTVTPAPKPVRAVMEFNREQLSAEIASLEADVAFEQQLYAKRPKIHRLNAASTVRDRGAWYKDDWRRKVERVGNQNYPAEARLKQIYGSLRLLVTIRRDGTLQEVQILESSGQTILDQAALRIVRLAAPFAPLTGDLAEFDRLEIVRTWRFERGDRLFSQ